MVRDIIEINEDLCNGCGECVPGCHEGALQIIDGKARLISDLMCDGLGACVGHCPTGAMKVIQREAEPYDERKVMETIIAGGDNVIRAHLDHLLDHNETEFYEIAMDVLTEKGIVPIPSTRDIKSAAGGCGGGCPGSAMKELKPKTQAAVSSGSAKNAINGDSQLAQWPVQLHLLSPMAPYLRGADLLLAADCTAFAVGDFHQNHLAGKSLAIACPKLDHSQENYIEKLRSMIDDAKLNTITVMIMEVPCCGGLISIVEQARAMASRNIPIKKTVVSIEGEILHSDWI